MKQIELLEYIPSPYGARMGRRDNTGAPTDEPIKLHLQRMRMVDGDYDVGGVYWGCASTRDDTLWVAGTKERDPEFTDMPLVQIVVRARDREAAKEKVRETYEFAKFYR